jgi:hypothetical protein
MKLPQYRTAAKGRERQQQNKHKSFLYEIFVVFTKTHCYHFP